MELLQGLGEVYKVWYISALVINTTVYVPNIAVMSALKTMLFVLLASVSFFGAVSAHPSSVEKRGVSRTSPPSGCLIVRGSGTKTGEYGTVSSAVAVLSATATSCIFIYPGVYTESVYIKNRGPLTIYGSTTK
jgi:pectinesterase